MEKKRAAVIGAGPAGERVGVDEHRSMYRDLYVNGPKELLEYADYSFEEHFGKPMGSCPPRSVLLNYIQGRANKYKLCERFVQYHTKAKTSSSLGADTQGRTSRASATNSAPTRLPSLIEAHPRAVRTGPESVKQVPLLERVDCNGRTRHFKDGSSKDVDAIILCTGYLLDFPFMPESLRLAWFVRDVMLGRSTLPSIDEMKAYREQWRQAEEEAVAKKNVQAFQVNYLKELNQMLLKTAMDMVDKFIHN
ncbi:hypothetical protein R1sor_016467 [Riccia sorocarpa]|uniref:Flavin-containing monooxygenase n=1 Tax=Riccia sorocarpa TaxID=122646 RepID=A0ABD3HFI8_9MARC